MKTPMEFVVAERRLTLGSGPTAREVRVMLSKPVETGENDEYYCEVRIIGVGDEKVRQIYGLDSMQALQLGLRFIAEQLADCRSELRWVGNEDIAF